MRVALLAVMILAQSSASGQDITGTWNGALDAQGTRLRLVFHIAKSDSGYRTTLDSPDQGARGIPVAVTAFSDPDLTLELPALGAQFHGVRSGDSIAGTWTQGPASLPLVLSRGTTGTEEVRRPQEPRLPHPYRDEPVAFRNEADGLTLAGTLTVPAGAGPHPAVVLITGSGPQDRDETVFGHRPFLVLADHLSRHAIAVLRCDDRAIGESTGEIDPRDIGLIGHSEGALIASMVAARSGDVAHVVLLAGTGLPGRDVSLMQSLALP